MKSSQRTRYLPPVIAFISLCLFITIILQYTEFYNDNKEKNIRANLLELLISKKAQIEKALNSRIYYTKGIAAYTSIHPEISNADFYKLADQLIQNDSVISTMSLARDCKINAIFPLKGHEAAIGLDLLDHPFRKRIVESTIKTRNTFVAGPVDLVEGGIAFISYTPIFSKIGNDSSKFWGVTDIVIWKNKLFNEIGLTENDGKYKYALRGIDGTGKNGKVFLGDSTIYSNNPVNVDVLLPTGNWLMASTPVDGWKSYMNKTEIITIILYISAFIISLLIWLLSRAIIKLQSQDKEFKALFRAMQDLIIEYNKDGIYVKIAPTNESLLIKPAEELIGKSVYDVLDKGNADRLMMAIRDCLRTRELIVFDYPIEIQNEQFWFQARISYLTENSVLFISHDNTKKMKYEEQLKYSEKMLKELNSTKDKLFSIIAHDLKSPFQGLLGYSQILTEDYDSMSEQERKDIIKGLSELSSSAFHLLETLLEWSRIQTGKISFTPELIKLQSVLEPALHLVTQMAANKKIVLNYKINDSIIINADKYMLTTIVRNLAGNAVKFTRSEGEINISAENYDEKFIKVIVADNGIGIKKENLEKLFTAGGNFSTVGTADEEGTGLGLLLCKEMVEKHNGIIWAESEPGKGATFYFTIPKG